MLLLNGLKQPRLLLSGIFVIAVFYYFVSDTINNYRVHQHFVATQCQILNKTIESELSGRSRLYFPVFSGNYYVNGNLAQQRFLPDLINEKYMLSSSAATELNRYQINQTYYCWYDPDNPSVVVLQRDWQTSVNSSKVTLIGVLIVSVVAAKIFFIR